jgi:hypothetical protein
MWRVDCEGVCGEAWGNVWNVLGRQVPGGRAGKLPRCIAA